MLVVYSDGSEVLVCDEQNEKKLLKVYFKKGRNRDIESYDRSVFEGVVEINVNAKISGSQIIE